MLWLYIVECGMWIVDCGLWIVDCGLWIVDCGLWIVDCGLWIVDCGLWIVDCGLWVVGCGCVAVVVFDCWKCESVEQFFDFISLSSTRPGMPSNPEAERDVIPSVLLF
jgi:hypothetical protein